MIGYEINFINPGGKVTSTQGPYYDNSSNNAVFKKIIEEVEKYLRDYPHDSIEVCKNDYLGIKGDFDFNDCLSRKTYTSQNIEELKYYLG